MKGYKRVKECGICCGCLYDGGEGKKLWVLFWYIEN